MYRDNKPAEVTVSNFLNDSNIMAINDAAAEVMIANRRKLMFEMSLEEEDIIDLPIIFMKSNHPFTSNACSLAVDPIDKKINC